MSRDCVWYLNVRFENKSGKLLELQFFFIIFAPLQHGLLGDLLYLHAVPVILLRQAPPEQGLLWRIVVF